jgi:Abnormal spindle-like microcephaly-assoc'd, ASPM-SPD-2-Hydin
VLSPLKAFLPLLVPRLFASLLLVVAALSGPWIQNALATSGHLHVSPGNLEFQTVVVGRTTTLTFQVKNTGSSKLCIYHLYSSKGQFTVSGPSTPVSIFPSKSVQFRVTFRPSTTGKTSALLEILSSAQAMVSFTMTGNGEAPLAKLQLSPTSLNFGSVNVSSGNSKTVTVKNTGDIPLKISGVTELGGGFGFSNLSAGVLLAPNQQHVFQVSFHPQSKGTISGRISIMSASLSSPTTLSLVGSGVATAPPPPQPPPPAPTPPLTPLPTNSSSLLPSASSTAVPGQLTIHLGWAASGSPVVGYRVHRGITTGGPYPNYTSDPLPTLDYIDTSGAPGATYYYVVTSIDSSGAESAYSNEVSATLTTTASASASGLGSSTLDSPAISASPQQTTPPVQLAPPPVIHLSWAPSESAVAGYRVYRSQLQSGPYVDYSAGPLDAMSFDDSSVIPGATYFYVVTSLDSEGDESVYSNQAAVALPTH